MGNETCIGNDVFLTSLSKGFPDMKGRCRGCDSGILISIDTPCSFKIDITHKTLSLSALGVYNFQQFINLIFALLAVALVCGALLNYSAAKSLSIEDRVNYSVSNQRPSTREEEPIPKEMSTTTKEFLTIKEFTKESSSTTEDSSLATKDALKESSSITKDSNKKKDPRQILKEKVAARLSDIEISQWYAGSSGNITVSQKCPGIKKTNWTKSSFPGLKETEFTAQQASELRSRLEKGSGTIRDAFTPWIDTEGFDLDLILHAGHAVAAHGGIFMGIFNGTVHFMDRPGLKNYGKAREVAGHLESVLGLLHERGIKVPDVIFPYALGSFPSSQTHHWCAQRNLVPEHLQDRYTAAPVAGIAFDPKVHTGIALLPNMYFGDMKAWGAFMGEFMDGGPLDTKWSDRQSKVCWRGKVSGNFQNNKPRVEALQAAARDAQRPNQLLDISLTGGCSDLKRLVANETLTASQSPSWLPKDDFLKAIRCGSSEFLSHADYTGYRAVLNLPGRTAGSYSRNLQSLWVTGAAVMIWEQSAVEFYYDTLEPGVTHIWVNATTIDTMTKHVMANDGELAQLLGASARRWFNEHLSAQAMLDYYVEWFNAWAALQRFTPTPDMLPNGCTCSGWVDKQKNNDGPKRCSLCKGYPADPRRGYNMLTGRHSRKAVY